MIFTNLRHLRLLLAVEKAGSITAAARECSVSQPAATQAMAKLEVLAGGALYKRSNKTVVLTERGRALARRAGRGLAVLDHGLDGLSPRAGQIASFAQLTALIAVHEAENFTHAAKQLGRSQPTIHRSVAQLEQEAGRKLFKRTTYGVLPTRLCRNVARTAKLAFAELDQAEAELADLDGREAGQIVIGALPLSRSILLPQALVRFRHMRPNLPIIVRDGPYEDLIAGLRRGEIDIVAGALRDPLPHDDIVQEPLFDDHLLILASPDHPMARQRNIEPGKLADCRWVLPRKESPSRRQFDYFFSAAVGRDGPDSVVEAGSILLMRELLNGGDFLGCISKGQAEAEIAKRLLVALDVTWAWPDRPIGLTYRLDWMPTSAQSLMLQSLRHAAQASANKREDVEG